LGGETGCEAWTLTLGRLEIQTGDLEGLTVDLHRDVDLIIGRGCDAQLRLSDDAVSRQHAVVTYDDEALHYIIEDLASTNGTRLNGKRIRSVALVEGDRILIGETTLRFALPKDD
jgi:pSer/pThr/pTyr-binding forkhead associated (FHA) protein